jgi:hypothetical protein
MTSQLPNEIRIRAKVLGCLHDGYLQVIVGYGCGLLDGGVPREIPMDVVPIDLRMPNSAFYIIQDRSRPEITRIERMAPEDENRHTTG